MVDKFKQQLTRHPQTVEQPDTTKQRNHPIEIETRNPDCLSQQNLYQQSSLSLQLQILNRKP